MQQNSETQPSPPAAEPPPAPRLPPAGRKFPCKECGARLDFDPAARALHCPYCGHVEAIQPGEVHEIDWDPYLKQIAGDEAAIAGRSSQVTCASCGAVVLLEDKVATEKCPYCGVHLENEPESAQAMIRPGAVLPFAVTGKQANAAFNLWIASRWFAPTTLRMFANLGQLSGVYAPFWTYDSMTYTYYAGERGDDYTVTRRVDGKTVSETRTRWTSVSGEVQEFFDDVMVYASQSLPPRKVVKLTPWDLDKLEDFKPDFLSGFLTERYTINLAEGWERARAAMDEEIRSLCCRDMGGDHQRLETVHTQHVGVTFKHILLPIWLATYRYQDKPYRILVNGRTGEVVGERPYSWVKIGLLVAAVVAAIIAIILWGMKVHE